MKIGIYGDSFGSGFAFNVSQSGKQYLSYIGLDWTEILASKYAVTNYSAFSSSLVYSADLLKSTHQLYDKVILLVTHPGRVTMGFPSENQPTPHFVNYEYSKLWYDRAKKEKWLTELNSVLDYYIYIYQEDHVNLIHNSLVDYCKKLRPDIMLVPNFNNSFENIVGNTLTDVFAMENTAWNIEYPIFEYDMRKCHMTKENNEILANLAVKWLNGDSVILDVNDFVKPVLSKEFYIFEELL